MLKSCALLLKTIPWNDSHLLESAWSTKFFPFPLTHQQQATSDEIQSTDKYANTTDHANGSECQSTSPPPLSNDEFQNVNIFEQLPCQATPTPTPSTAMIFMKIRLTESDDLLLFESNSYTMVRDSNATDDKSATVAATGSQRDNEHGDEKRQQQWRRRLRPIQFLMDNDKHRGTNDVETQTIDAHYKTRAINTNHIEKSTAGTFVSNYLLSHDTFVNLERTTQCVEIDYDDRHEQLDITTYTNTGGGCNDLSQQLETSKSFQLSSMILQRVLASNVFYEYQRRFRNMYTPQSLEPVVNYLYRLQLLYRYRWHETAGNAISCMSWCPRNTDILAIGYGAFKCEPCKREHGAVCLWNIKVCFEHFHINAHK